MHKKKSSHEHSPGLLQVLMTLRTTSEEVYLWHFSLCWGVKTKEQVGVFFEEWSPSKGRRYIHYTYQPGVLPPLISHRQYFVFSSAALI